MTAHSSSHDKFNTPTIRKLLTEAFSDEDFNIFCYDYFPDVHKKFSTGMDFQSKIQRLIVYCDSNNLFDKLLMLVKGENPDKYAVFSSSLIKAYRVKSSEVPSEDLDIESSPQTDSTKSNDIFEKPHTISNKIFSSSKSILGDSPFICGGAVPPDLFYGREATLRLIARRIGARSLQSISIVGERRIGKSSLLNYIVTRPEHFLPQSQQYVFIYLDLMKGYCHTRPNLFRAIRRELQKALGWEPWLAEQDGDLGAFDFALEDMLDQGKSLILCLDQMENLTKRPHEFDEILEDWRANGQMSQMAMITSSTHPLADLCASGGLISPFYNIFIQETLGLLTNSEWQALLSDQFEVTNDDLAFVDRVAGGHPFFTQMAADALWSAYQNGIFNYNELYEDLLNQIEPHMASMWRSLSQIEQSTLREAALGRTARTKPDQRTLNSLNERGLLRDNHPFSLAFAEGIRSGRWS